jgi:hypothetical protein
MDLESKKEQPENAPESKDVDKTSKGWQGPHILTDGRAPFLEFLRNLTPQVILLAVGLRLGAKLHPFNWDPSNWQATSLFIVVIAIWLAAVYANTTTFIEKYLEAASKPIEDESKRLFKDGVNGPRHIWEIMKFSFKNQKSIFFEMIILVGTIEVGLLASVVMAIQQGSQLFSH